MSRKSLVIFCGFLAVLYANTKYKNRFKNETGIIKCVHFWGLA